MSAIIVEENGRLLHETVSHFANMGLRITPRQIRHWDKQNIIRIQKDESGYRRLSQQDIEKITLILMFKTLGFSLSKIKKEIACLCPKEELLDMLKRNPEQFVSKQKDGSGKKELYPKPEIRESWKQINKAFTQTKSNLESAHDLYVRSQSNLTSAIAMYRAQSKG